MAETKDPSPPLSLSAEPHRACPAQEEALPKHTTSSTSEGYKLTDDCPFCADIGTSCAVGSHPPAAPTGNRPFVLICSAHIQLFIY
jgi:hypothetical protein